jgi:hypothetical protein
MSLGRFRFVCTQFSMQGGGRIIDCSNVNMELNLGGGRCRRARRRSGVVGLFNTVHTVHTVLLPADALRYFFVRFCAEPWRSWVNVSDV